jgi:hypothetical protein
MVADMSGHRESVIGQVSCRRMAYIPIDFPVALTEIRDWQGAHSAARRLSIHDSNLMISAERRAHGVHALPIALMIK